MFTVTLELDEGNMVLQGNDRKDARTKAMKEYMRVYGLSRLSAEHRALVQNLLIKDLG